MDRRKIALWRHQQIEELADPTLGKAARRELLRKTARLPVRWPSGDERPVSEPTLRRWLRAYAERGLEGLMPRARAPARRRPALERAALEHAFAHWLSLASIAFTLLTTHKRPANEGNRRPPGQLATNGPRSRFPPNRDGNREPGNWDDRIK